MVRIATITVKPDIYQMFAEEQERRRVLLPLYRRLHQCHLELETVGKHRETLAGAIASLKRLIEIESQAGDA